ncbi:MAG: cell division protein ZapA [Flavobacteriales bacterium]|nr:cell division protein ZapA [Flavobacteriales bacterium]
MGQRIKVKVADRFYPMTVQEGDEEAVRVATKSIEELIRNIENKYSVEDRQDVLAMCAVQFATKYEIQKKAMNETFTSCYSKIESLNEKVFEALQKNKKNK